MNYLKRRLMRKLSVGMSDQIHFDGKWFAAPAGSGRLFWGNVVYFRDYAALSDRRSLLISAALLAGLGDRDGAAACLKRRTWTSIRRSENWNQPAAECVR